MYKAPRGTHDTLPPAQPAWRWVETKAEALCQLYGYERLDTPVFEDAGLFVRTIGEGTDIVEKEMYTFNDRGGKLMTLKPEGTAAVCRAYLEHGLYNSPQPVKLYYFSSLFRYERPQAGRYRQHHQFGCEALGDNDPTLDAETIEIAWQLLTSLGLNRLNLELNSIGCKACRPGYKEKLQHYYSAHSAQLCPDCLRRLNQNPLRLLDCKQASCQTVADAAPSSLESLCNECQRHFQLLTHYLELVGVPFNLNHRLVRGLDYYTRTVFEIQPANGGAQSTLCGGGRYDDLIQELGGQPTPGVGFAAGIERIIQQLQDQAAVIPPLPQPQIFIAALGDEARDQALSLANSWRQRGIGVFIAPAGKSLKAQLRQAHARGIPWTAILGEEEMGKKTIRLRHMLRGEEQ
ncbi:MAG: histidine--tRNA ligase, partial [Chloroflexota bacterium]